MELNEYQDLARKTGNNAISLNERRLNYALGLGEVGELQNVVKKHVFHGHDEMETVAKVLDEAGDSLWYLTQLVDQYDLTLEEVAQYNLTKLRRRYPEGFSQEASRNRTE